MTAVAMSLLVVVVTLLTQVDGGHIIDWQVVRLSSLSLVVVAALLPLVVVATSSMQVGRRRVIVAGGGGRRRRCW